MHAPRSDANIPHSHHKETAHEVIANQHFTPRLKKTPLFENRWFSTLFRTISLGLLATALTSCQRSEQSEGVELVTSTSDPSSTMTFELRFDAPMVATDQIGISLTNSPLAVTPPLHGTFNWLSASSGVFTPDEPLALDTRYNLSLHPGLVRADGHPSKASLHRLVTTPPFGLVAYTPRGESTNAISNPQVQLLFNDEVRAADAQAFICFRDETGHRIPADVCQGTVEEMHYDLRYRPSNGLWYQPAPSDRSADESDEELEEHSRKAIPNLLVVGPRQNLPIGRGWRLSIASGLPSRNRPFRLHKPEEIGIGDVTPFGLTDAKAVNYVVSGPSVRLSFSKAIPDSVTNALSGWLDVSPCPTNVTVELRHQTVFLRGAFRGGQEYRFNLHKDFEAIEPFRITGDTTFSLEIPHIAPRIYFPTFSRDQLAGGNRTLPLLTINVPRIHVRAKILDPQTAIYALRGYASYFMDWNDRMESIDANESYHRLNYDLIAGHTVFNEETNISADRDVSQTINLKWDELLHGRKTGVVFLDVERPVDRSERTPILGTQALIQLTDLGMVWKRSQTTVDVFAFSHSSGKPVPGATVRLFGDENESLAEALTDTNGCARLTADTNAQWVAVQQGDDFHAMMLKEDQVWLNHFDIPFTGSEELEDPRRVLLFSDRSLYRPGEPLYLCGLVRQWADDGLAVPPTLAGTIDCLDRKGRSFFNTNSIFGTSGNFSVSVPIPSNLHGDCTAKLRLGTNEYVHSFSVQDFQPDAFRVTVDCTNSFGANDPIAVPVAARYFFGKALSHARLKWSLEASDWSFHPDHFGEYQFNRIDPEYRHRRGRSSVALNGEGMLAGSSNFVITPEIPMNPVAPQPRLARLQVEITDLNQQTICENAEFVRHSSDYYLGLRQAAAVLTNGDAVPLEVLAVGSDGKPWPKDVKARLNLQRIDWQTVRIQGAGKSVRYHNETTITNVLERDIEIPPVELPAKKDAIVVGNRLLDLPTLAAGEYVIEASAKDPAGRPVISSMRFQVSAPGQLGRNYRNDTELTLKADQPEYQIGKSADILVEAPFSGTALVTIERERVLRSFTTRLEGNAPSIHVPLLPGDEPNVFVSVALMRGADECPHKIKEPEYRLGICELQIVNPQSKLAVTVTPTHTNCLPAETVEVTVNIADALGAPVPDASVVLYAVDEGILSLSDPGLPNPHDFFYASRPLGVRSSVSLPNLLTEDPEELVFENKGFLIGGGGDEHLRKKFLPCAFWQADLTTDSQGQTVVHFPAPDSLTRYRLCAVAHKGSFRFGSGQSAFHVTKPLVIEPALPAFVNISDHLVARGVIQNQTTNASDVLVTLQVDDKVKDAPTNHLFTRTIAIPANGAVTAEFPIELADLGPAIWIWKVRFADPALGEFVDSVQSTLEVGHVVPMLREVLLTHSTGTQTNLVAHADPQLLAGRGTISVTIANTRLNDLGEAASQLLHYPYGCAEQTGSSLLPWIVLRDAAGLLPSLRRTTNEINAAITYGVDRLFTMQTGSGGLAYWPRSSEPMLWASAYGGMVLALAQQHGIEVSTEEFDSLMNYLSKQLRESATDSSDLSDRCLALYTLALAGRAEPAYHEKLFAQRDNLSSEDRALLALAIAQSHGPDTMIEELLKPASKRTRALDDSRFGCLAREEAIRLLAWSQYRPDNGVLDRFVDDLMREQKEAHWGTTQGDAWALLALTEYARLVEGKLQSADGAIRWNDQTVSFHLDHQTNLFSQTLSISNLTNSGLVLRNSSSNRLYSSVMIEARPPETQLPRQDRGFGIQRRYQRLDDDNRPVDAKDLRVGDRVLVTLAISVHQPARFVAVDDALPCILEAVNPEFNTRQTRPSNQTDEGSYWLSNFREFRKDRCLYFVDSLYPGNYTLRYIARVRAAGTVTAPPAKIEEMYHPERCGLSGTQIISSTALE